MDLDLINFFGSEELSFFLFGSPSPAAEAALFVFFLAVLLSMFAISVEGVVCHLRNGKECFKRWRALRWILSAILVFVNIRAFGLLVLAMGMGHGSSVSLAAVFFVIVIGLLPVVLLIHWAWGSPLANGTVVLLLIAAPLYWGSRGPSHVMELAAENGVVSAQVWLAENGAKHWWYKAADKGHPEALYQVGKMATSPSGRRAAMDLYRQAASQGHERAMLELIHASSDPAEKARWLQEAFSLRVPEALYLRATALASSNPGEARRLFVEAAEGGSVRAMEYMVRATASGNALFEADPAQARLWKERWQAATLGKQPGGLDGPLLSADQIERLEALGARVEQGDPDALFEQANRLLSQKGIHPAAKQRAQDALKRAAQAGHAEAALQIARQYQLEGQDTSASREGIPWYELAVKNGSLAAMEDLARHYLGHRSPYALDADKALHYSTMLVEGLEGRSDRASAEKLRHWMPNHQHIARLAERDRSLENLRQAAITDPNAKFRYGKESLELDRAEANAQIEEAAQLGDHEAAFYLAEKTLRQPRSFKQETNAIASLQTLANQGYTPAYTKLANLMIDGRVMTPSNHYLARQLIHKAEADPQSAEHAKRLYERLIPEIKDLGLENVHNAQASIQAWYERHRDTASDADMLAVQYANLMDHYADGDALRRSAESGNPDAQYAFSQHLLNHDFRRAMDWLTRAAEGGSSKARYELARRIFYCKKNPPEQYTKTLKLLEDSVDPKDVQTTLLLASLYSTDHPGSFNKDAGKARMYYQQALNQMNDSDASYSVSFNGRLNGVRREVVEAKLNALQ